MAESWQEIDREEVFKKYSRKIDKVTFKLPDGLECDFYIKNEGPAAAILALTTERKVILVKQFRPGPKMVLEEMPGGYLNGGEDPAEGAARELLEETGYAGKINIVGPCLDDAYSSMVRYCVVATDCKKVAEPQLTKTERPELVTVSLQEFKDLLRSGQMTDVEMGYMGLDYLGEL